MIGYSVVNSLEDSRLKRITKSPSQAELDDPGEVLASQDNVFQMCLALQKTVDQLKHKVNILSTRVGVLEDELTTANDKILTMRNRIDSIPDESQLMRQY